MRRFQNARSIGLLLAVLLLAGCTASAGVQPPTNSSVRQSIEALPRIPWEGGSSYWTQFERARDAGWDRQDFFPIAVWFNSVSTNEQMQYDKSLGINTYVGLWEGTDYKLLEDNGAYFIGPKLNDTFTKESKNWVGYFLGDEIDAHQDAQSGLDIMKKAASAVPDGYFSYSNYTLNVASKNLPDDVANAFVNNFTDVVSADMYWYTVPYCSNEPYWDETLVPVRKENCRRAASYGKVVESLRQRDSSDTRLQPVWQFVENLNGGYFGEPLVRYIGADELKGAVMSSIISEARGLIYFNQSLSGKCRAGSVFRESEATSTYCGADQVAAASQINQLIQGLATVLNSQSYDFSFGEGLKTMFKMSDDHAYIFSMVDGDSLPGPRTFALPPGVRPSNVEVLNENREIPVDDKGVFVDEFSHEYSFHIYKFSVAP